jgi:glycosyltransferase involved in cell wall biosynthesis
VLKEEYALVVAGGLGWDSDETWNRIQQLQAEKINIVTMGYVNDAVRTALYKNALMVVVPSFYEGFGMPILEAMSYGTPVAASNLEVFKEVGGNAAVYFEPHSVESIRETIIKILGDSGLRKKLVEKGKAQLKKYSWQKVADDINEAIERLAG